MPRLDTKKKLQQRSERVKSVDLHPVEPWVLTALYTGHVNIWNYQTNELWKQFEVTEMPIRACAFVARKQWFITGSDDFEIRAFNYNTSEKVHSVLEAHQDYIRDLEVHPSQPWVLSSADDMTIKLWNWEKNWECVQSFEGHAHYVMMVKFNPKDSNTFASASLDRSIKVWSINSMVPNYSLEGHTRGVNCLDYYHGGDKPYIISGSDDFTLKVWDYQTKACVSTLEAHGHNVSTVAFHPRLPVIISGSEDGTVRLWHNSTYRLEATLNYGLERCWSIGCNADSNKVALGFDEGLIVLKLGKETPVASMDKSGRFVIARKNGVSTANLRGVKGEDGEKLSLSFKDMGSLEMQAHTMKHNYNGRFLVVVGDNEYVIYTALGLRNKSYGSGSDFVWARGSGDYAVRESSSSVKIFRDFKPVATLKPNIVAERIFGGTLLAIRGSDSVVFYEWETQRLVRCIDIVPKNIYWSENGQLVALACEDSYYILQYNADAMSAASSATGEEAARIAEEGVEAAFDLIAEKGEKIRSATWVGDVLIYTNSYGRLNYYVGGEVITHAHLEKNLHLLGYLASEQRVYLMDKSGEVVSYRMYSSTLEYQTAVVRRDFETANSILPSIPEGEYDSIGRFLEGQGFKEEALHVTVDPDQKFDLALQLNKLEMARDLMRSELSHDDTTDAQAKWKQLGDLALAKSDIDLAEECARHGKDFGCLLLVYSSIGNAEGLSRLAQEAKDEGRFNVAFISMFVLRRLTDCINLLVNEGRLPEAVLFARTYQPSALPKLVEEWTDDLQDTNPRAATVVASPDENPELFPEFEASKSAERIAQNILSYGSFSVFDSESKEDHSSGAGPLFMTADKPVNISLANEQNSEDIKRQRQEEIHQNASRIGQESSRCNAASFQHLSELLGTDLSQVVSEKGENGLAELLKSCMVNGETNGINEAPPSVAATNGSSRLGGDSQSPTRSKSPEPQRPPPAPEHTEGDKDDGAKETDLIGGDVQSPVRSNKYDESDNAVGEEHHVSASPEAQSGSAGAGIANSDQSGQLESGLGDELDILEDNQPEAGYAAAQGSATAANLPQNDDMAEDQQEPDKTKHGEGQTSSGPAAEQGEDDTDEFVDAEDDELNEFAKELDEFDMSDDGWGV